MACLNRESPQLCQKRGCTAGDRGIARGKVTIAAAAALLMFAAAAEAQLGNSLSGGAPPAQSQSSVLPGLAQHVDFVIDFTQSWLSRAGSGLIGTDAAGNPITPFLAVTPQNAGLVNGGSIPNGSLSASVRGDVYFSWVPGVSIQFFTGAQLGQPNPDPAVGSNVTGPLNMEVRTTGNYKPGRDNVGNLPPSGPPPQPGNFGEKNPALAETLRDSEWAFDSPLSLDPTFSFPAALPLDAAGHFDAHGVTLLLNKGSEDTVSGIALPNEKNVGSTIPIPVDYNNGPTGVGGFQPPGTVMGTLGLGGLGFILLPINIVMYSEVRVNGTLLGYNVSAINGQIFAVEGVPEPSTVTLFGLGVVILLAYAWRRRLSTALY